MMSYESLRIFKLIKINILCNFLALWNFFLQFSTLFKIKQYQLSPVISMHVENQCSSLLKMVSLIYFIVSEINILIKFRKAICYTFKINCKSFEKMDGFPINMQ